MSRTTLITSLIIVVVVIIGGVVLMRPQNNPDTASLPTDSPTVTTPPGAILPTAESETTSPTTAPTTSTQTVTYTASGFSPATLTVKAGTTVMFQNNSSAAMWVASDPHPIHTTYSDFDANRGYTPGQSYSFTFTKSGSWTYHDHLNPGRTGKVIVE